MTDLENEMQVRLFKGKMCMVDPTSLNQAGFKCLIAFFESINQGERKLKKFYPYKLVCLCL